MGRPALSSRIGARLDGFVPPALLAASPEDARRARLGVAVAVLMAPVFSVLSVLHFVFQNERESALNGALAVLCASAAFAVRRLPFALVLNSALALTFLAVVAAAVFARGAGMTAATVALAEIPLFATLLGGIGTGAVWVVFATLAGVGIGWLGHLHLIVEHVPRETVLYDDHMSLLVITATLFLIGAMYEMRKNESLVHIATLEEERRRVEREKLRAEAEVDLARAERLASMGRLAASAAHEINNPLSYVANNLDFIDATLARSSTAAELRVAIVDARDGVERIRRIVSDLKTLTRSEDGKSDTADVASAVKTALQMAEGHTRSKARVSTRYEATPLVVGDEAQLVRVFLNLLINAAQSIDEGHVEDNEIAVLVACSPLDQVFVEVRDTGSGIAPDILGRIFDPFFTTRPVGEGTGLGLALCDGIVRRYGGRLELDTSSKGTVVRVVLEIVPAQAHESAVRSLVSMGTEPPASPLRVLLVDDEPLVARALARILRGHAVTVVQSGREALSRLGTEAFDMVFCDIMMPDLSGMEVYEALEKTSPELLERLVFMSGGTFTERAREFRTRVPNPFIEKPLDRARIAELIAARTLRIEKETTARRPRADSIAAP